MVVDELKPELADHKNVTILRRCVKINFTPGLPLQVSLLLHILSAMRSLPRQLDPS
jgi:hypothetical protein